MATGLPEPTLRSPPSGGSDSQETRQRKQYYESFKQEGLTLSAEPRKASLRTWLESAVTHTKAGPVRREHPLIPSAVGITERWKEPLRAQRVLCSAGGTSWRAGTVPVWGLRTDDREGLSKAGQSLSLPRTPCSLGCTSPILGINFKCILGVGCT